MAYDLKDSVRNIHRISMEENEKREKEKEVSAPQFGMPKIDSQEYVDNLDIPGAMDDDIALLLYIVTMVGGVIFHERVVIWVGATILYLGHVFRRKLYKAKWEREHKDK